MAKLDSLDKQIKKVGTEQAALRTLNTSGMGGASPGGGFFGSFLGSGNSREQAAAAQPTAAST